MKKTLLSISFLAFLSQSSFAQLCSPSIPAGYPMDADSSWIYPKVLPCAKQGVAYKEVISIKFPASAEFNGQKIVVDSVYLVNVTPSSIPSGFAVQANQTSGSWQGAWDGGTLGCVSLLGQTNDANQTFTPKINMKIKIIVPIVGPQKVDTVFSNFSLEVSNTCTTPPSSIESLNYGQFETTLYPNPTSGLFSLLYSNNEASEARVEFFNILGEQVFTQTLTSSFGHNLVSINASNLAEGMYSYKVYLNDKTSSGNVVIKK